MEVLIPLDPVPASRARITVNGHYYSHRYKAWIKGAHAYLSSIQGRKQLSMYPVYAEIELVCRKPKRPTHSFPMGDIDNYAKAVLDSAVKAGLLRDDKYVVESRAVKRFQGPGEDPHVRLLLRPFSG